MPTKMMPIFRSGAFAALSVGAILIAGGLLTGGTSTAASAHSSVDRWVVPQSERPGNHWTAERMRAALPGDSLIAAKGSRAELTSTRLLSPMLAGAAPELLIPGQNADSSILGPNTTSSTLGLLPEPTITHIGKVFFTEEGTDYVCSGNAITSTNKNTVATAGHCVNEGPGAYVTNWAFAPGYSNGSAPYGTWDAVSLTAPTQWTASGNITYDTGFAVVAPQKGKTLSATVGASGVVFNKARGLAYTLYGYPAELPFTGESLQSCSGTASPDSNGDSGSQGVPCNMTGGSSGGPWLIGSGANGMQNSINSYGYTLQPNTMYGPYWGSVIESAYTSAAA